MKKLILPLLMLMASAPAFSQIVRSTTFTKQQGRSTEWFVRLGLSCNNLTGDAMGLVKDEIEDDWKDFDESELGDGEKAEKARFGTRVNFDLMFGFNKYFGKTDLYWGMELGLGTRGGSYTGGEYKWISDYVSSEGEDKCYVNTYNVKFVPFEIGYKFPVTDKLKIDAHLGVFVSFDYAGAYTEDEWRTTTYNDGDATKETFNESWSFGDDYADMYRFDAGLQLGVGVWFGRFNLNFTWQRGFAPYLGAFPFGDKWYDKNDNQKYFNSSNAILSLGVAF